MLIFMVIILAAAIMLVLAAFMTFVLGWASKTFHVELDPRVEAIIEALPGANCGGCGYAGCSEYAEGVVAGKVEADKCTIGGASCATALANILGIELEESFPYRPVVHCGAQFEDRLGRNEYTGEPTCGAADVISGVQGCTYGCLGLGDCELACDFDAIHMAAGLATVDYQKCVGCGACARVCPRNIISMVPFKAEKMLAVACCNDDFGKQVKAVCNVGCTGCKLCTRASDLFSMDNNLSRIDYDKYDPDQMADLEVAVDKCPVNCLVYRGRPAEKAPATVASEEAP